MTHYVTFGQTHCHEINGTVFDKDCVATYESDDGLVRAFELFGDKFCFHYDESTFDWSSLWHFPRGVVEVRDD